MTTRERKNAAQRSIDGALVYRVGFAGGTENRGDDLKRRKPRNEAESQLFELMESRGWTVTKRGWPDFFCVKGGDICAIEVKPCKDQPLKANQLAVMGMLSAKGVRCFKWTPDGGFEEIMGTVQSGL